VLQSVGQHTTAESLVPQVYLPGRKGSLQVEMLVAARRAGLLTTPLEPTIDAMLREVAAGHPVLVFQNLSLPWYPVWHYAVVIGYDREAQTLFLHSGVTPRMPISFSAFDRTWERGQRWAIVATTPSELPATSSAETVAKALVALERLQPAAAQKGYAAALVRWPANRTALLGAGNTAYALGDLKAAQAAYAHAVQVDPLFTSAWNNLAQTALERGTLNEAHDAIRQVLRLNPSADASVRELERKIAQALAGK
jgi:tetratricopeptide (TPR) repeat protein